MTRVDGWARDTVLRDLRQAARDMRARGLFTGSKWAAELVLGLASEEEAAAQADLAQDASVQQHAAAPPVALPASERLSDDEEDRVLYAQTLFASREYRRCADELAHASCTSQLAVFLRCYALFLAGEKLKNEQTDETTTLLERSDIENVDLDRVKSLLQPLVFDHADGSPDAAGAVAAPSKPSERVDGFCLWLYGVVLREQGHRDEARRFLHHAVARYPLLWSSWLDLCNLCDTREHLASLPPVHHWTMDLFSGRVLVELQDNEAALHLLHKLRARMFPRSTFIQGQVGMALYNLREFEKAEAVFQALHKQSPHSLEFMDTYSNILYVHESKAALSYLAHEVMRTDKFRPETCLIVGNYYSLKNQHERAILYFRRALSLNRSYLAAWTLVGHEFIERRAPGAAIESYRRALDINPRDYRAWYGLGQTYELLRMLHYALYYFRKAAAIRPYDSRMWCAVAGCYEGLNRPAEAIKCYERATSSPSCENLAYVKLGQLYEDNDNPEMAYRYHQLNLDRHDSGAGSSSLSTTQDVIDSLAFLARYECEVRRRYDIAEKHCLRLLDTGAVEKEDAKALLHKIRARVPLVPPGAEDDRTDVSMTS